MTKRRAKDEKRISIFNCWEEFVCRLLSTHYFIYSASHVSEKLCLITLQFQPLWNAIKCRTIQRMHDIMDRRYWWESKSDQWEMKFGCQFMFIFSQVKDDFILISLIKLLRNFLLQFDCKICSLSSAINRMHFWIFIHSSISRINLVVALALCNLLLPY